MQNEYYKQDYMYSDDVLWQRKGRYKKERWYQRDRNTHIDVSDEEDKDPCRKFGVLMKEFDKLNELLYEWQVFERERSNNTQRMKDEKIRAATFI